MSILRLLAEQMTVPDDQGDRARPYRMFLRDLVLPCRIGVYAHEKLKPQRVRINVSMRVEPDAGPRNDDIAHVLSYDEVLGAIKRLAAGEHINLVETLAEAIAEICLADRRVVEARVMIEKLDVEPGASVGVEIERRRRGAGQPIPFPLPLSPTAEGKDGA
jgi:7,8-dihydroneopterin aldolase/epimerase/oxygenase